MFLIYTILALLFSSIAFAPYVSEQKINGEVNIMPDKDDLLSNNYIEDSISVNDTSTGTDFTVQSVGEGTFLLNGTFNKTRGYFRLTDQLHFSETIDRVAGSTPVKTIVPSMTLFDFDVKVISGTQNATEKNKLRIVFRGTTSTAALQQPAYDFYSGIDNANYTDVDIGMLSLYITQNIVCENLIVKVELTPK